jgi:nucleoside-diphosphate-sugar epimerase
VQKAASDRLKVSIVRPRGIFGEYDSVLVPRLLHLARNGKMPVFNDGKALVDVTYAGNVADAMLLCDGEDAPSGTFNITNGEPIAIQDLLGRVFRALSLNVKLVPAPYRVLSSVASGWEFAARVLDLKTEPKLLRYTLGLMNYSQTLNISAAREKLGYTPNVSIDEGLKRFAAWYQLNSSGGAGHEAA